MSALCARLKTFPTHMDFDGQRKAERIFQTLIVVFAGVGLVFGYMTQQFSHTVYFLGAGFLLSCLLIIPPWPFYRQKPLQWQKVREEGAGDATKAKKKKQ